MTSANFEEPTGWNVSYTYTTESPSGWGTVNINRTTLNYDISNISNAASALTQTVKLANYEDVYGRTYSEEFDFYQKVWNRTVS